MSIVIYHNPECGTSRNVLMIIEAADYKPTVIVYLKTGWTKPQPVGLFTPAGLTPKTALRTTKSPAVELGLLSDDVSDEDIFEAMIEHPVPVNRPIVCSPKGVNCVDRARLCWTCWSECQKVHSLKKTVRFSFMPMEIEIQLDKVRKREGLKCLPPKISIF